MWWQILTELWGWPVKPQMENSFKCETIMRCTVLVFCIQDEKRILCSADPCAVLARAPVVLQVWGRVVCLCCLLGPPSRGPSGHSWGAAPLQWSWHESGSLGAWQGKSKFIEQHEFHYHAWNRCQDLIKHSRHFVSSARVHLKYLPGWTAVVHNGGSTAKLIELYIYSTMRTICICDL